MDKLRDKILAYFFEEPEKEFYVRELAKTLKKSPTTISKYMNELKKEGILVSEEKYGHLFFRANSSSKLFLEIKKHYNLMKIRNSGLIEHINEKFNYPSAIILFGSFAKGENNLNSDIDLLIITSSKKEFNLEKFEKKLNHKIQIFVYSQKEIQNMKNKELLNSFINGIILEGYMEVIK